MQLAQVKSAILAAPKGSNIIVEWLRNAKVRKGCSPVSKSVRMVGRMGIEYDNMKVVEAKREDGTLPAENNGLPWGVWAEYPYLIEHKGNYYLRLYNGTSATVHAEAHFFRNGDEVTKESIMGDLLASEKEEKKGDCFCCKVEDITRIHTEAEFVMVMPQEKIAVPVPASVLATLPME